MVQLANRPPRAGITNILLKIKFCISKVNRCSANGLYGNSMRPQDATRGDLIKNLSGDFQKIHVINTNKLHSRDCEVSTT